MQASRYIVGVDVAKAELVTATDREDGHEAVVHAIPNRAEEITQWLSALPQHSIVAMESSGRYHQLLAQLAHAAGQCVFVLNARDVQLYAKAISARGKTDRLDAGVIARYVREHQGHLQRWQPASGVAERLQCLLDRRVLLTQQRVCMRSSLQDLAELAPAAQMLEQAYSEALAHIDAQVQTLLQQEPALQQGAERLQSITGVGVQAAVRLAALFSRIGFANANAVVAYSGLDPRPNDSGTKRGRRHLSKRGPALLRRQLYLVAFAASHSKVYGATYQKLRERLSTTEALVALARKLLRVAWAVWRSGQPFDACKIAGAMACEKT